MSCQDGTDECVINVFCSTELRESKPKNDDSFEEVIECCPTHIVSIQGRSYNCDNDVGGTYATSTRWSLTSIRRG